MSANPSSALEGTQSPSPFEVLWDRYRSLILTVVGAILLALVGNYAWQYLEQKGIDERWSKFAATIGLDESYVDSAKAFDSIEEALEDVELSDLESALGSVDDAQKPYVLLAIARKAMMEENWERAESALASLESGYPKHTLVQSSPYPVQTRDPKKLEKDEEQPDEPQFEGIAEGSIVGLMRKQIASMRGFRLPSSFEKPAVPADAPKVKFTFGDRGSCTIALMDKLAPKHAKAFLDLASAEREGGPFWQGIAVDEIHRSTETFKQPYALHFGFASTKEDDRTKWTTTEESEHQVEFEETGLSHFEGAVSGRAGTDGKSCVDRLWISVDDEARQDGSRVVFGFVVEGLDVLREICEAGMSAQEEQAGRGKPTENIRITAVEVL
ncbi:MAG TPA: hypothetical protein ENK10_06175 [Acidobacteria bacterium]|nr:hypothetical protein [Acidobacteriota bacterium]